MNGVALRLHWLVGSFVVLLGMSVSAWSQCSPILIDLGKNGIELGAAGVGVHFDVDADGTPDYVQWVRPSGDEGFLAYDRNGNGVVDDGGELFGVGTPLLLENERAANGFVALAQYDQRRMGGNDDGYITSADAVWSELRIWRDLDADGVSVPSEMFTPAELGLTAFETIPKFKKGHDRAGNAIPFWAWARSAMPPRKVLMVDVFFRVLPESTTRP